MCVLGRVVSQSKRLVVLRWEYAWYVGATRSGYNGANTGMKLGKEVKEEMEPGHVGTCKFY